MELTLQSLIEFGLSEKEARTYLTLLELEIATVQEIAREAKLNRSSTYVTLESLKEKGLVSVSDDKKIRQYIATSPEAILRLAQDEDHKKEIIKQKIETVIPNLKALYKGLKKKPVVRVFEGKEGIINSFIDTFNVHEKLMRVYSSPSNMGQYVADFIPEYVQQRYKKGIKMHGIHPDTPINRNWVKHGPKNFDEYVLIPEEKYSFNADLAIYDSRIAYMVPDNGGIAIIIESIEMSNVMKQVFDLAFQEAKRLADQTEQKQMPKVKSPK